MISITQFEALGDIPVPGGYDGDGTEDFAIYRNGEWWINNSGSGNIEVSNYGLATHIPIPSKDNH